MVRQLFQESGGAVSISLKTAKGEIPQRPEVLWIQWLFFGWPDHITTWPPDHQTTALRLGWLLFFPGFQNGFVNHAPWGLAS